MASFEQTIVVKDTTPPVMNAAFVDAIYPIESKDVSPLEKGTASDNCDHDVSINVSKLKQHQTYSDCDDAYNLVRSWTARDGRGNEDSKTQTLTSFIDITPPIVPAEKAYCAFRYGVQLSEICKKDRELIFDATGYHVSQMTVEKLQPHIAIKLKTTELISCEGPISCRYDGTTGKIGMFFADTRQGKISLLLPRKRHTVLYFATVSNRVKSVRK